MANGVQTYNCGNCGAPLNVDINREFVFCGYCGCKNQIAGQSMQTTIEVANVQLNARTNIDSMLNTVDYAISCEQYDRASEILLSAIMSGADDYRVFIKKATIDLLNDSNKALFEDLSRLEQLEKTQQGNEVTLAIQQLMYTRGCNGVIALHVATFHEQFRWVQFCVNHGADVNCVAGFNRVTPISIMFVPQSAGTTKIDGTPFVRNKAAVKQIRDYLMSVGAQDIKRKGY